MIEKFLDTYELKARVAPGLILALPILSTVLYAAPVLRNLPLFAADGICTLALIYGLSHVVRARGTHLQSKLWERWDGSPQLDTCDATFGDGLKSSIRNALSTSLSIPLLTSDEEAATPGKADKEITDAFRQVRTYLRQHDPNGLWSNHNAEYGFCRNLLACRSTWALIAFCATAFAIFHAVRTGAELLNAASAIGFLSLVCSIYVGWLVLPRATKRIGESYAESAWMSFLRTAGEPHQEGQ